MAYIRETDRIHACRVLMERPNEKNTTWKTYIYIREKRITMEFQEKYWENLDWIDLAHVRHKCRALVNTAITVWVS